MKKVDEKDVRCCKNCARTTGYEGELPQLNPEDSTIYCYEFCQFFKETQWCYMFKKKEVEDFQCDLFEGGEK